MDVLKDFRSMVESLVDGRYKKSDAFLVRWLKAKEWDADAATKFLKAALDWRKANDIDTIGKGDPDPQMFETFMWDLTFDKEGCPVLLIPLTDWKFKDYFKGASSYREGQDKFNTHQIQAWEKTEESIHDDWSKCRQFSMIWDLDGFTYGQLGGSGGIEAMKKFMGTYENYHPEGLKGWYIINSNPAMQLLFRILKSVTSSSTQEKAEFYKTKDEWKPVLQNVVEEELLPPRFGGTLQ